MNKSKSEETRGRILSAALHLFRERGFDQTTMREVAKEAGVALGSAYYYFESKETIVMAFYHQAQDKMVAAIDEALPKQKGLKARLRTILDVKFEHFEPNRKFLGALLAHTADPKNPLSPFSEETRDLREKDAAQFAMALENSGVKVPDDLKPDLPNLLWMFQMGLILFWMYDRSPGQKRTAVLVDKSLDLVVSLIKFSGLPLMKPVRRTVLDVVHAVSGD
ncbi:MAG: TetR family transcriptional regulator [Bryobacteraceae bacterium]